jgi:hypothetical protein
MVLDHDAKSATKPGWFFCSYCQTPYEKRDKASTHFAGYQCKNCAKTEEGQKRVKAARREPYN